MPVKRRNGKSRQSPQDEMELWSATFWLGRDLFCELGITSKEEAFIAAREPWERLGRMFLDDIKDSIYPEGPWALRVFGEPPCR